jgi:tetratricopeptide (TPR) repeat protein
MRKSIIVATIAGIILSFVTSVAWSAAQARLRGRVLDAEGQPIATAQLKIVNDDGYSKDCKVEEDGSFRALILDATRTYMFVVSAPGYAPYEKTFKVLSGTSDNVFDLVLTSLEQAQQASQVALLEQPGYKEYDEAVKLIEAGQPAEARPKLLTAVEVVPDLTQAWQALADIDFTDGAYDAALGSAEKCLELDDESVKCLAIAANAAQKLGNQEAYEKYMAQYRELNPDDPAIIFNEAATYLNRMDDEGARPALERCLEADPDFPKCLYEYGMLLLRSGDMEGAKQKLQRYLEVDPEGPDAATAKETIKYL